MKSRGVSNQVDLERQEFLRRGVGQVSYLRMVNMDERIHCCFLMGKARVTSKKFVESTHLELVAAALLVKVANFLRKESGLFKHLLTCVY